MKLQKLLSLTRKAIYRYNLIDENDKIAIGISGGKDSLALLYAMVNLKKFYPVHFEIEAITIDLGMGMDYSPIEGLCRELDVHYTIVPTQIKEIVFDARKESNPCSLCSKLRKGTLNEVMKDLGCNKVAYAHNKDDMVETFLMSLIFEGRIHTFAPKTYLEKSQITLIRPLIMVNEADIIGFKNKYNLPVIKNLCPADGYTKREEMKMLVKEMNKKYPNFKERVFTAIINGNLKEWY